MKHIKHVKYIHPVDRYIKLVPDYSTFGCKTTLRMNPKHITDLHWQLEESLHTTNIGQTIQVCTPSAMACFRLLSVAYVGYDTEVICVYGTEPVLLYFFYCLLLIIVVCDLYFNSHILIVLIISFMLITYIPCINCVYVREYYQYSLTHNKSLF